MAERWSEAPEVGISEFPGTTMRRRQQPTVMRYSITVLERLNKDMTLDERTHVYTSSEVDGPDDLVELSTHDYIIRTDNGMAFHPRNTVEINVVELEDIRS